MKLVTLLLTLASSLEFYPTLGPTTGNTSVLVRDSNFQPNSLCYFGDTEASETVFINITSIICFSPGGSGKVAFSVSKNLKTLEYSTQVFTYYNTSFVSYVSPLSGSEKNYHELTLQGSFSASDSLSCKLGPYEADGVFVSESSMKCTIPPFGFLQHLRADVSNQLEVFVSKNKQQYTPTGFEFNYLLVWWEIIENFEISENHGPEQGGTEILVTLKGNPNSISPKCLFGENSVQAFDVQTDSFKCNSPPNSDSQKVSLRISLNGIDYGNHGKEFVYDKNVSATSLIPNQGTENGGTLVRVLGKGFKPYPEIKCLFGTEKVPGVFVNTTEIRCVSPEHPNSSVELKFTLNNQNYYSAGNFQFRPIEKITLVEPQQGPTSGNTKVLIETSYFHSPKGFCKFGKQIVELFTEDSNKYCLSPPGSGTVDLYVSSNSQDFESSVKFTYYTNPKVTAVEPKLVTNQAKNREFTVYGENFQEGKIKARIGDTVYDADIQEGNIVFSISEALSVGKHQVRISLNNQNYGNEGVYIEVVELPVVESVGPAFGFLSGGIPLQVKGSNFFFVQEILCLFDSEETQAKYISSSEIVCLNPSSASAKLSNFSVSFNQKEDLSNNLEFEYIDIGFLESISKDSAYNREQPEVTVKYSCNKPPVLVQIGSFSIKDFSEVTPDSVTFSIPSYKSGTYPVFVYFNYFESLTGLSFTFLGECKKGYYCPLGSQYQQIICPKGHYCPHEEVFSPFQCDKGTYSNSEGAIACEVCDTGKYCPEAAMEAPYDCPPGYLCNSQGLSLLSSLELCPPGYACMNNTQTPCPDKYFCSSGFHFTDTLHQDFRSPQLCIDGVVCERALSPSQYGSEYCPPGYYCLKGEKLKCLEGHYCPYQGMEVALPCVPGTYSQETAQSSCRPCGVGFICPESGNTNQTICPAGRVCAQKGSASPSSVCPAGSYCLEGTDSEIIGEGPLLCPPATFCLMGVESNEVRDNDASSPQTCIQGTYCEEGTTGPQASPCPPGYFCPAGVSEPIIVEKGHFAKGYGNSIQQTCSPGTFSSTEGMSECEVCPEGYFCPYDGTVEPLICPAGTYREEDPSQIECSLCPQGTWSDVPGLSSKTDCKECEPELVCLEQGMTNLTEAADCPEGYICSNGTTSFTLTDSRCPGGFWCGKKTSKIEDLGICEPGYYCPEGTTETLKLQYKCLAGYFCPQATNASLNERGTFGYINQANYQPIIDAKIQANRECQDCDNYQVPSFSECEENSQIPEDLLQNYQSLKCPSGTTSPVGAKCVGECTSLGDEVIVQSFDPSLTVQRRTQESKRLVTLQPLEVALLNFNLTHLDPAFLYGEHFTIRLGNSEGQKLPMPAYFSNSSMSYHTNFTLVVNNYSEEEVTFTCSVSLHNALYYPRMEQFSNVMNTSIISPSRAKLSSSRMFFAVIWKNDFEEIDLPFNLIQFEEQGQERMPFIIDSTVNYEWFGQVFETPPFDETFWIAYDINTVAIGWMPFFMNCEVFGDRIYFHQMLENELFCDLVPEKETVVVNPVPFSGISPTADSCEVSVKCYYAEDVMFERSNKNYWFEVTERTTLFYITRDPQSTDNLFTSDYESIYLEEVLDLADTMIPVEVVPHGSKGIPTEVKVVIKYYQNDPKTKSIVSVEINLENYSLEEKTQSHPGYTLKVEYYAIGWFELLNNFQLGIPVYILVFVALGLSVLSLLGIVYFLHMLFLKNHPKLHFQMHFLASAVAPALGTTYGSIPVILAMIVFPNLLNSQLLFPKVSPTWEGPSEITTEQELQNSRGRLGLAILCLGIVLLVYGARFLIPLPEESTAAVLPSQKYEVSDNDCSISTPNTASQSGTTTVKSNREAIVFKRRFFLLISAVLVMLITIRLEFSYSEAFKQNIFGFLFGFMILDIVLYHLLSRLIFGELLLVSPFYTCLSTNKLVISLASENFIQFLQYFLFTTGLVLFQRIYFNPFLEYLSSKFEEFSVKLVSRYAFAERLFRSAILKRLKNYSKLISKISKQYGDHRNNMEGLMTTMLEYSSQVQAVFMAPFVLFFIYMFADETQVPKNYGIQQSDVSYYVLFSVVDIVPHLIIDVLLFHLVESLYGYKLFDYLTYNAYRFKTRNKDWKYGPEAKLDRSISINWRSIDYMCYSSQFYFSVTITSWGFTAIIFGATIMLRNSHNPFSDPLLLVVFFAIVSVHFPTRYILKKAIDFLKLWKPRSSPVFTQDFPSEDQEVVQLIDDYTEENALVQKVQTEMFKTKFISKNKDWLIKNIAFICKNNYVCQEFLREKYFEVFKVHAQEKRKLEQEEEHRRQLEVIRNIPEHSKKLKLDQHYPEPVPDTSTQTIAFYWLNQAKLNLTLKEETKNLFNLDQNCQNCSTQENLTLAFEESFYKLLSDYQRDFKGLTLTISHFQKYCLRKQKAHTYCRDCKQILKLKKQGNLELANPLTRIAAQEINIRKFAQPAQKVPSHCRKIALKWLIEARSRITKKTSRSIRTFKSLSSNSVSQAVSDLHI